jgi:hypothetical protein
MGSYALFSLVLKSYFDYIGWVSQSYTNCSRNQARCYFLMKGWVLTIWQRSTDEVSNWLIETDSHSAENNLAMDSSSEAAVEFLSALVSDNLREGL